MDHREDRPVNEAPVLTRGSWPRTLWAGFLSLGLPGLGQIYAGAWRLGILLYVVAFALPIPFIALTWLVATTPYAVAIFLLVGLLLVIFRLAIVMDASRRVRRGYARGMASLVSVDLGRGDHHARHRGRFRLGHRFRTSSRLEELFHSISFEHANIDPG
jgi:hypothetical protein